MPRPSALPRLQELAQEQWGLLTRRQIETRGIGSTTLERLASPGGGLERVATGVYPLVGAPIPDHLDLRAAWLQLDPAIPAWERTAKEGSSRTGRRHRCRTGRTCQPIDTSSPWRGGSRADDPTSASMWSPRGPGVDLPARSPSDQALAHCVGPPGGPRGSRGRRSPHHRRDPACLRLPRHFADSLAPHAARFGLRKVDGPGAAAMAPRNDR